jgi:spore coat protein U-like protein
VLVEVKKIRIMLFFALYLLTINALSAVVTSSLSAVTMVEPDCRLNSTSLSFGNYNPIGENKSAPLDETTTFQVGCTKGAHVTITLNNGLYGNNATQTSRAMSAGDGKYLSYELYFDPGRSNVWSISNPVSYVSPSLNQQTRAIYGRIPGGQNVAAGNYHDTVTITASF